MMTKLQKWVIAMRHREEEGQSLAEYGLILALIAVAAITALTMLGGGIAGTLQEVASKLPRR